MPRRQFNEPVVLRDACLQNIACHFDSYWCAGKTTILHPRSLRKCIGSFEYLSDDMIQNLLKVFAKKKLLRRHYFQFLLSSNIRRLNLSVLGQVVEHVSVLQTVGARCPNLTHLNLSRLDLEGDVLCSIIPNLGELVSLDLCYRRMKQNVLKAVAENCPNLLELNIKMYWSKSSPDYDIQEFANTCISKKSGVPKLKTIRCFLPKISVDTVAALLKSQRSLETFHCMGEIHDAFDILYGKEFKQTNDVLPEWIFPLSYLDILGGYVRSIGTLSEHLRVELTLRCCPYVTDLYLINITDTSLSHVSNLRHLKHFYMSGVLDLPINFSKSILPILMKLGNNLLTLSLNCVSDISFIRVGTLCPNLDSLRIFLIDNVSEQNHVSEKPVGCFKHLTNLTVTEKRYRRTLSEELLLTMLSNATHLRELWLQAGYLTDDLISKSNQIHGFRYLEKASFDFCGLISAKTGMMLLHTDSPLRQLSFHLCENIKPNDKDQLNQEVSRMRLDVDIRCVVPM